MDNLVGTVTGTQSTEHLSFSKFAETASDQFVPLAVSRERPGSFQGSIRARQSGQVAIVDIRAGSHSVHRSAALIARRTGASYKLTLQLAGTGLLVQDDREALLRPGDIAFYDTDRPYSLLYEDGGHFLVFMFPRHLLQLPENAVAEMTAVRFPGTEGVGPVVGPLLSRVAQSSERASSGTAARLANGALDFVTTMLSDELDLRGEPRDARRALARRVQNWITDRLGEDDLTPARIAAAHFVSARYLHGAFHEQGTTVSAWVKGQRLDRCARDLADVVHATSTVAAIAARWGIHDSAWFSRAFKERLGVSPTEYRAAARAV